MTRILRRTYYVGVDLAQAQDHSAIAVVERAEVDTGKMDMVHYQKIVVERCALVRAERIRLGTPYAQVAARVGQVVRGLRGLGGATVVADATGVGAPVMEMLRKEKMGCQLVPVVITGGHEVTQSTRATNVPKKDLMMKLVAMIETRELVVAADMPGRAEWEEESRGMRLESLSGRRDDVVLAVALACWRAKRGKIGESGERLVLW